LRILDALEKKINRHSYDTWLKPNALQPLERRSVVRTRAHSRVPHAGDKYATYPEAIDNRGAGFNDVKFVTPEDDPASTSIRHDGGLSAAVAAAAPAQARFDWDGAAQLSRATPSTPLSSAAATSLRMRPARRWRSALQGL